MSEQIGTRLADSIQLVTEVITLVRDVMSNLRPTILDDYGLESALQAYINEFQTRYGIPVQFEKQTPPIRGLDSSIEITLLRISQEALTTAVMQRYHVDTSVRRALGSKLGSLKERAAA